MDRFVIYTRVSTKSQGKSGLGLEAQQRDIKLYLNNYAPAHQILGEFQEIESGSKSSRETLQEAVKLAKAEDAVLLVSKLDRLSRDVEFIADLTHEWMTLSLLNVQPEYYELLLPNRSYT